MHKQRYIGFGALILGIAIAIYATTIDIRVELYEPGPRLFPMIAGIGIAGCGVGILVTEWMKEEKEAFLGKDGWKRYLATFFLLVAYYLGLKYLGFLLATPIMVVALSRLFTQKKYNYLVGIIVALVTTAVIYYLFEVSFKLMLPAGMILGR